MVSPTFFDQLRALRPQDELRPGLVFVAILHFDKSPEKTFDQADALWIRCPKEKDVSSLVKAYRKACPEAGEFVLRHNFQPLEDGIKVSAFANRYPNDFVAVEAVRTKDLDSRRHVPIARSPLSEVSNGVNRLIARPQSMGKPNEEPDIRQYQPRTSQPARADGTSFASNPQPAFPQPNADTSLQLALTPNSLGSSKRVGWEDFLFERSEFPRQALSVNYVSAPRDATPLDADKRIGQEWLSLDETQKAYFIERGDKITASLRFATPENRYTEHWAFWVFYYSTYFRRPAGTEYLDHDFEGRKSHIEEFLATWKAMGLGTRKLWFDHAWGCSTAAVKRGALADPQWATSTSPTPAVAHESGVKSEPTPSPTPSSEEVKVIKFDAPVPEANFHVDLEDAPTASNTAPIRLSMSDLFDGRTPEQLEKSVEKGVELLSSIQGTLRGQSSQEGSQWLQAIDNVQKLATRSKTVVGVVGATGAGKSSVINALLDEERLVPTNCMRACTAVVTEISYNHEEGDPYRAEVEFISRNDWQKMLKILFEDLLDGSGQVSRECTNEDSESGIAYAQIKAVYPKMTKEEMEHTTIERLMAHDNVTCLGTTRDIESDDSLMFYKKLQRYVDSKEKTSGAKDKTDKKDKKPREMEFWPLIRVVRLYTKAPALATGAVIVDLPGVHDSNQARAAVAQSYMKQCTGLWIVAPITRAVDDKSAKALLGDTFKRQLKMDGGYNSVTFICSKTDDISITEAQDSLGLDDEFTPMWEKSEELRTRKKSLKHQIDGLKDMKADMLAAMEAGEDELEVWEKLLDDFNGGKTVFEPKQKSQKRKRADDSGPPKKKRPNYTEPDSDDDFIDDGDDSASDAGSGYASSGADQDQGAPLTENDISMKIADLRGRRKEGRREKTKVEQEIKELHDQITALDKESDQIDGKLSAKCISGRNEYSRVAIRQDYAAGIRELDQEIAEEEDAANFDPEVDRRDYDEVARNLPVFCVSSRAYQKLKGRLQKDNSQPGFSHIDETEVPALQAHCIQMTTAGRQAACRKYLTSMFQLLNSLRLWSSNDGTGRQLTEGQLKREAQILKERMSKLDNALEKAVAAIVDGVAEEIQEKVYEAYPNATSAAKSEASNTVRKWASPVDQENLLAGGFYWSTYKAIVRRDGVWTNARGANNFNEQLIEPVIRHIAGPWESVFARRMPGILNSLPMNVGKILTTFHDEVERRAIRNGASLASFQMLKQQISVHKETLKDAMIEARNLFTEKQRTINREFEPKVLEHMLSIYHTCTIESGPGQFARMKGYMDRHVEHEKQITFDDAVEHVRELVKKMLKEVKDTLLNYTGVIVGQDQSNSKTVLPRDQRLMRKAVLELVDSAETVFKRTVGLESEPTPEPDTVPGVELPSAGVKFAPAAATGAVKKEDHTEEAVDMTKLENVDDAKVATTMEKQRENQGGSPVTKVSAPSSGTSEAFHIGQDTVMQNAAVPEVPRDNNITPDYDQWATI
ncbi:hypothetical protein H2200_003306 [Cladophialophora chaetospira]|uniref:Nuclear GTPase SLIP-GC n=1 Tax=Cladophialophora chaetospira TaxID=386627 RepID=A0AA38XH70_9EURO|nr:hypothetical protein H2200_003306 [Cladophialophora chaetospira]